MGRAVCLAAIRIKTPAVQQLLAELLLTALWQIPPGQWLPARRGSGPLDQGWKLMAQGSKQDVQPRLADVGLKRLGQGFPATSGLGQLAGLLLPQAHQLLEGRGKQTEIALGLGLLPAGIAPGLGLGDVAHQGGIQPVLAFKFLAQQLEIAAHGTWGAIPLRFCRGEQIGIGPTALAAMELLGEQGQLFATPLRPRGGHGGVLVVIEGAMDRSQQLGGVQIGP